MIHVPIEVFYAMICILMVTQASFAPYLKNLEILTLSNSDTFQFGHFPIRTLSNSDPFQCWHIPIQWHFSILTLSESDTFQFWHFPILTLSNSDTIQSPYFLTHDNVRYSYRHKDILDRLNITN